MTWFIFKSESLIMRKLSIISAFLLIINSAYSQRNILYQTGTTAEMNLNAIGKLAPYSDGGLGFDNRYEGIKGSPRLYDTLLALFLKVKGEDYYLQLGADIDLIANSLIFVHPKTRQLLSIPADMVSEVIINSGGKELIYRTTFGLKFEKELKEPKFFQVLEDGPYQFIKMPVKKFIEADYKGLYTSDRRYDEYQTSYNCYIKCADSIFHQIKLTRNSLTKLFPEKKRIINNRLETESDENNEEMVLKVLEKF